MARRRRQIKSMPCDRLTVEQWFERDRQHVMVSVPGPSGRVAAEWWDDEVTDMVRDGFFRTGGLPHRNEPIDPRSVIEYMRENGLCRPGRK